MDDQYFALWGETIWDAMKRIITHAWFSLLPLQQPEDLGRELLGLPLDAQLLHPACLKESNGCTLRADDSIRHRPDNVRRRFLLGSSLVFNSVLNDFACQRVAMNVE